MTTLRHKQADLRWRLRKARRIELELADLLAYTPLDTPAGKRLQEMRATTAGLAQKWRRQLDRLRITVVTIEPTLTSGPDKYAAQTKPQTLRESDR